ncbi:4186_t:CDS:2, partial [Dentiscutata heterogama]
MERWSRPHFLYNDSSKENGNSKKSKCKTQLDYSCSDEVDNQSAKKNNNNKRLKSKSSIKYVTQQDTLGSDNEVSQNIRKLSKKKKTNHDKKCETLSDSLKINLTYSSTNDSIENGVESANILVVVIEENEHFSNRQ